ncbi:hydroxymethylbilane synthase [uncultured Fenollaria sp.]|uniref:hydroxymethylbilane synthase n=1 Tax=uncultured Fenollaria sp. TaxID=1686315 RepID=UPI0025ED3140|nr:hydroxymethylbilane synthase [uncultured Fenollaria sp.]
MKIKVGTRTSRLALKQVELVFSKLKEFYDIDYEVVGINTLGDIDKKTSISQMGGKGVFVRAIEEALKDGRIDIAVHSLKDMTSEIEDGLEIIFFGERARRNDIVVLNEKHRGKTELENGMRVATGSLRRKFLLAMDEKYYEIAEIRGNIESRIAKLDTEGFDAIILSRAAIDRLDLADGLRGRIIDLDEEAFLPSPCQGVIALEVNKENHELKEMLKSIQDEKTDFEVGIERAFLDESGASCNKPLGIHVVSEGDKAHVKAFMASDDLKRYRFIDFDTDKENYLADVKKNTEVIKGDIDV